MINYSRDTPRQHKQRLERTIVLASLALQAVLSLSVVGFCIHELGRCPVGSADYGSEQEKQPSCPRALYTNIITATVAMWFPSPYYGLINSIYGVPSSGEGSKSVRKRTTVEDGVEEDK